MRPTLHMFCGKIASGKSTLAAELAAVPGSVLISEDAWLNTLFGDRMASIPDYLRFSAKLREAMEPHVAALLGAGISVILDFPANTPETRQWMRRVLDASDADHELHLLDVPDETCLARMTARNASGDHPFAVTEDQFRKINAHFRPPSDDEGFQIVRHRPAG